MRRVHVAFVSPLHTDIAADLAAVAAFKIADAPRPGLLCARYGMDGFAVEKPFAFAGGLAFVPVHGLLVNRFNASFGMATGYDYIRSQLRMAVEDPDVSAIVLDINSNGGMAAGCNELAQEIYNTRSKKPSLAVVDTSSYSGAYYLGSAASKMICTESGGVGSIGVVAAHVDFSKLLEKDGITVTFIHAGEAKVDGNQYEPLSERARESIDRTVQYHYGMFAEAVAKFRGMSVEDVKATEARCYTPPDALKLGLIDGVASATEAVRGLLAQGEEMSGITQDEASRLAAEAAASAVAADRARTSAIRKAPEAEGREALADHLASSTNMSVEDAIAVLTAAPKQEAAKPEGNAFAAAMDASNNPNVGQDNPENLAGGSTVERILNNFSLVTGGSYRKAS